MNRNEKHNLSKFKEFLEPNQASDVLDVVKKKRAGVFYENSNTTLCPNISYPQLNALEEDRNLMTYVNDINNIVKQNAQKKLFKIFSSSAEPKITKILSGNVEHTVLQRACAIQLFSKKPLHALVLGSNLGNTLINTLQTIAPISTVYTQDDMGNLLVIRKHKQYDKGILAKTNDGLFIMLNFKLERPAERNPIVSAMEKGYVVVERNNFTGKFAANINVLAFAIPDGIRLLTKSIDILKRQIPFSRDILHKFHLVFVVQKPKQVSEALSLKSEDVLFLRSYIAYCRKFKVTFDKKYDGLVDQFMAFIKNDENHFVVDVREKIAAAVKRLACARAAMHMREDLSEEDVKEALKIVRDSLYVVK